MASDVQSLKETGKKVSELEREVKKLQAEINLHNKTIESLQPIVKGEQAASVRQSAKP